MSVKWPTLGYISCFKHEIGKNTPTCTKNKLYHNVILVSLPILGRLAIFRHGTIICLTFDLVGVEQWSDKYKALLEFLPSSDCHLKKFDTLRKLFLRLWDTENKLA